MTPSTGDIALSIVCPAHNERDNIAALVRETSIAVESGRGECEIIIVDDGSTDETAEAARALLPAYSSLRVIRLTNTPKRRGNGQSAAFLAGFRASRGRLIATLDADLQNDPADIPAMLRLLLERDADMIQGDRSRNRCDSLVRRVSSRVGRLFRRALLGDSIRDTGCSLRVMKRELALRLPLEFRGMHRFIPITARQMGYHVIEIPVSHRPRARGRTKYGIFNRALPGLIDCFAVRWMRRRRRSAAFEILERDADARAVEQRTESEAVTC